MSSSGAPPTPSLTALGESLALLLDDPPPTLSLDASWQATAAANGWSPPPASSARPTLFLPAVSPLPSDKAPLLPQTSRPKPGHARYGSVLSSAGGGGDSPRRLPKRRSTLYWLFSCCRLQRGTRRARFTLLILACITVLAGYLAFDVPSITALELKGGEQGLGIDSVQFGLLYSVYSLPNIVLPLLSGVIFSRVGRWKGVVLFAGLNAVGNSLVAGGVALRSFPLTLVGRTVYGLGGESVYVGVE